MLPLAEQFKYWERKNAESRAKKDIDDAKPKVVDVRRIR
jgi:hypothetical protein